MIERLLHPHDRGTFTSRLVAALRGPFGTSRPPRRRPAHAPSILRVGTVCILTLAPPPPGNSSSGGWTPQALDQDARILQGREGEALRRWALTRLETLDSQSHGSFSGLPHSRDLERLWALYFLSVQEKSWEAPALALADTLTRASLPEALHVEALAGALEVVRAKHSRWPPNKLKHFQRGVSALDRLVAEAPRDPVVRFLRLVSCYYLPFFLDRDRSVEEDIRALTSLLPEEASAFSPTVYDAAIQFVLETGALRGEDRRRLEAAREGDGGPGNDDRRTP